ncbi:MAG TPA: deoxyribodipyrimidine photo-lyase [Salinivirgaceae bacterium]|nr:deoxyribodipyrimidine photo-lyase [Salinivirgaceae bacterium]
MSNIKSNVFWFRRDLRLDDNHALYHALKEPLPLRFIFIFDTNILRQFDRSDPRLSFIFNRLWEINSQLQRFKSSIEIYEGTPYTIFNQLISRHIIQNVFANEDYEPYVIKRDNEISTLLSKFGATLRLFTDHIIFHPTKILKPDQKPYTIFTPYKNQWIKQYEKYTVETYPSEELLPSLLNREVPSDFTPLEVSFPINPSLRIVPNYPSNEILHNYAHTRDFPALDATSKVSSQLRFGIISTRKLVLLASKTSTTYLSELIWREFFISILYHFPNTVTESFHRKYDKLTWNPNENDFRRWYNGETGYPIVDAGMRQLNTTGFMHNRVRMIVASFLTKHLLIDWRWGEAYFAQKLHDFEQSSNVGNWQWAASTGCDAVPYFRIFNPNIQTKRFDPNFEYIKKWVPEFNSANYPKPIVEHNFARNRALERYSLVNKIG